MAGLIPFGSDRYPSLFGNRGLLSRDFLGELFDMDTFSSFRVDIIDLGDKYEIDAEMPGLNRENIEVTVRDGHLTISATMDEQKKTEKENYVMSERRMGSMSRSFVVGDVKDDEISGEYKDGVLKLTLPKSGESPEDKTKKIEIK